MISTGHSITSGLQLLEAWGLSPVVIGTAMLQTERWTEALQGQAIESVLRTPLLPA